MLTALGIASFVALVLFTLTWMISVRVRNYGFLDVAWSYGLLAVLPVYLLLAPGPGLKAASPMLLLGALWSVRLGTYILRRVLRHHPSEDVRYLSLRQRWPGTGMFFLFFQLQAALIVLFSLPFLVVTFDPSPAWGPTGFAGFTIALLSLIGESVADRQLARFKATSANPAAVCQVGLWRYSRHPNYFFESMVWWGFSLMALGSPGGWITLLCPLLMLYFLWNVTGIPLTEAYALKSKGDAYREYQRTTNAFIPWFPKT